MFVFLLILILVPLCKTTCGPMTVVNLNVTTKDGQQSGCQSYTTDTYTCQRLQDALDLLKDKGSYDTWFNIDLGPGTHYITQPVITNASVSISSASLDVQQKAVVSCSYDAERFVNETGNLHSLYFDHPCSVSIVNVEFQSCPLPLRIDQAYNVTVERSFFRYSLLY